MSAILEQPSVSSPEVTHQLTHESEIIYTGKHLEGAIYKFSGLIDAEVDGALLKVAQTGEPSTVEKAKKIHKKSTDLLGRLESPDEISDLVSTDRANILAVAKYLSFAGARLAIDQRCISTLKQKVIYNKTAIKSRVGIQRDQMIIENKGLGTEVRALRDNLLTSNHQFRNFFDSPMAHSLKMDNPEYAARIFEKFDPVEARAYSKGISLEIAAKRYITKLLSEEGELRFTGHKSISISYGTKEQDAQGGDVIIKIEGKKPIYIDLKNSFPKSDDTITQEAREAGYSITQSKTQVEYTKITVWATGKEPVSSEAFELVDPGLRENIGYALLDVLID